MNRAEIVKLGERFVVIEGGSGAGKTTAVNGVVEKFDDRWKCFREPGGTVYGEKLREVVQEGGKAYEVTPTASFLGYSSTRANLVELRIIPWLQLGGYGLSDRYWYSSYAYQGGGEGVDKDFITMISAEVTKGLEPALTIYFDLAPELAEIRMEGRPSGQDRYDVKDRDFRTRVRDSYLELATKYSDRWVVVDASKSAEEVLADTLVAFQKFGML